MNLTLSGTVTTNLGEPLAATIEYRAPGSNYYDLIFTNSSGKFTISNVSSGATLIIDALGYKLSEMTLSGSLTSSAISGVANTINGQIPYNVTLQPVSIEVYTPTNMATLPKEQLQTSTSTPTSTTVTSTTTPSAAKTTTPTVSTQSSPISTTPPANSDSLMIILVITIGLIFIVMLLSGHTKKG